MNRVYLDGSDSGTFIGPIASTYRFKPELKRRLGEVWDAAHRGMNRYYVLEGVIVRAGQPTEAEAIKYMAADRVLVRVEVRH